MSWMKTFRIVVASLALTIAGVAVAPSAGSQDPPVPTISVDKTTVAPGEDLTISGNRCLPEVPGQTALVFPSAFPLGDTFRFGPANADGTWSATVTALPYGPHGADVEVSAVCRMSDDPKNLNWFGGFDYGSITVHVTPSGAATVTPTTVREGEAVTVTGPDCPGRVRATVAGTEQSLDGPQGVVQIPIGTAGTVVRIQIACTDPIIGYERYQYDPVDVTVLPADTRSTEADTTVPALSDPGGAGDTSSSGASSSGVATPVAAQPTFTG
jgi:hypothetical protein